MADLNTIFLLDLKMDTAAVNVIRARLDLASTSTVSDLISAMRGAGYKEISSLTNLSNFGDTHKESFIQALKKARILSKFKAELKK